jgi:hypothetical protein
MDPRLGPTHTPAMHAGDAAESPPSEPRGPSRRVVALAATVVLALLAGTIAAAVLLSGHTPPSGGTVPSASARASTSSSVPSTSTVPEPTPTPSVIPYAADAPLLQVSAADLRMRAAASTSAEVIRTLDLGEVVRVMSGPVNANGYAWDEVLDLDSRVGWVAMGGGARPWLATVPRDPAKSPLLLRVERDCDASLRGFAPPVVPGDVTLTADGRVVLISGAVRQLSPSGLAQVQRDVLQLPALQASATYRLELLPGAPEAPGHGLCDNSFTLGEGTQRVFVSATNWQGDEEEATYWLPSPKRRALDELAMHLLNVEAWLGPAAWSEPVARRYVSSSYQFWLEPPSDSPLGIDAPSLTGAAWPFDGPIEQFGEPVGEARCGYLELGQAFETLRLMRQRGVPTYGVLVDPPIEMALDGFGYGNFATDTGWFSFWLTFRSPDGYPNCGQ